VIGIERRGQAAQGPAALESTILRGKRHDCRCATQAGYQQGFLHGVSVYFDGF
jgi:hypothetical protein